MLRCALATGTARVLVQSYLANPLLTVTLSSQASSQYCLRRSRGYPRPFLYYPEDTSIVLQ